MTTKIQRSSGNVFRDLGFPDDEAENLKIRTDLMVRLSKLIATRGLTQAQAARLFGVTQPRVSNLVRGKIDRFSIDTLVAMLGHAGVRVQIVVGRASKVACRVLHGAPGSSRRLDNGPDNYRNSEHAVRDLRLLGSEQPAGFRRAALDRQGPRSEVPDRGRTAANSNARCGPGGL